LNKIGTMLFANVSRRLSDWNEMPPVRELEMAMHQDKNDAGRRLVMLESHWLETGLNSAIGHVRRRTRTATYGAVKMGAA
jgi:hypothetical protein